MFKIGDFSKLTQVSIRMLRYYDEMGLLKPAKVDEFTGYRLYSISQISKLNKIIALRDVGFLVADIALILEENNDDIIFKKLEEKKQELLDTIYFENQKLLRLESMIKSIEMESVKMEYEVKLKAIPSYKVISLRRIIPAYNCEGMLWGDLGKFVERENIHCSSSNVAFAIYHDREYKERDVDTEVVMAVDEFGESNGEFIFRETEAVPCIASIMVPGPFENIAPAFESLANWLEKNENYTMTGTSRQVCHKGPWNENNPEDYLTEIQVPVEKVEKYR